MKALTLRSGNIEFTPETIHEYFTLWLMKRNCEMRATIDDALQCWMHDWMSWHLDHTGEGDREFIVHLSLWSILDNTEKFFHNPNERWDDMDFWNELSSADYSPEALQLMHRALFIRDRLCNETLLREAFRVDDAEDEEVGE